MSDEFSKGNYNPSKKRGGLRSAGDLGSTGEVEKKADNGAKGENSERQIADAENTASNNAKKYRFQFSSGESGVSTENGGVPKKSSRRTTLNSGNKYRYQFSSGETEGSGNNGGVSKKFSPPPTPSKPKWPWIAAISTVLVIAITVGVIRALPSKSPVSEDPEVDALMTELKELAASLSEDQVSADEYYGANATVLEVSKAAESSNLLTEAEAVSFLRDRGFAQYPVTHTYSMNGNYYGETVASGNSSERHPMYQTYYSSTSGVLWTIYLINGEVFADPVSVNLEYGLNPPVLVSESSTLTSYDNSTNTFYTTVPHETEVRVRVVGRIDAAAVDNLTSEEVAAS